MFVKIGDFYISSDEIEYIKRFPSGCVVHLKSDEIINIVDISDEDWEEIDKLVVRG